MNSFASDLIALPAFLPFLHLALEAMGQLSGLRSIEWKIT